MKLSVSITPEAVFEFGSKQIVAKGFATEHDMAGNPNKGWSRYIQELIREDMRLHGELPNGAKKKLSAHRN